MYLRNFYKDFHPHMEQMGFGLRATPSYKVLRDGLTHCWFWLLHGNCPVYFFSFLKRTETQLLQQHPISTKEDSLLQAMISFPHLFHSHTSTFPCSSLPHPHFLVLVMSLSLKGLAQSRALPQIIYLLLHPHLL